MTQAINLENMSDLAELQVPLKASTKESQMAVI